MKLFLAPPSPGSKCGFLKYLLLSAPFILRFLLSIHYITQGLSFGAFSSNADDSWLCVHTMSKAEEAPHPSSEIVEWRKKNPFIVEFLELLNVTLFGKSVFADRAKLSIFRRDPTRWSNDAKSNHKYPYKSNTEGDDRHGKGKGLCGRSGRGWSHDTVTIRGMPGFTKAGRRKTYFAQAVGGSVNLPNLEPATQKLSGNKIPVGLHLGRGSFLW